jgi:cellulose synthase/poly-beta-1,6-N-acetylglucosamine synthase-like glycosyltransferase
MSTHYKFYKEHFVPDDKCKYFVKHKYDRKKSIVTVIFPFFNEEYDALERSLISMHKQEKECETLHTEFHYVAIMDGWFKASSSMQDYIQTLFPSQDRWYRQIEESKNKVSTLILQKVDEKGFVADVRINKDVNIKLSVIVKKDNRRKANSHEWYFKTFVKEYDATYAFATDCGTLYADGCLYNLIEHLDENSSTIVATGRQRVMSSNQEHMSSGGLMSIWYRACQAYDYESSVSSFQGAFSLLGMLPVVPGPCGLYRMEGLQPALDHYFKIVNVGKEEIGLLLGNLLLAEDRILSYAAVFFTGKFSKWVPGSIFYFEAETITKNFIAQRRRWTNGSFAGYIYLIRNISPIILKSQHSIWFKMSTIFMLLLQCLSFFFAILSPALFASMLYKAILTLDMDKGDSIAICYLFGYMLYYIGFSMIHHYHKFVPILYNVILTINGFSMLMVIATIMFNISNMSTTVLASVTTIICIPFLLSLAHSFDVFIMMLFNFLPFMFFLPTFIAWFSAYAVARISDLSWGNRPSSSHEDKASRKKIESQGSFILVTCIFFNLVLVGVLVNLNIMELLFMIITIPTLVQQVFSLLFFMFSSSHLLSEPLLRASSNVKRGIGIVLMSLTLGLLITSVMTPDLLETQIQIIEDINLEVVDYSYVHMTDNNICTGQIDKTTAFLEENDKKCFYEKFVGHDIQDISKLNILEDLGEKAELHESYSVLNYIATNNPLKHGFREYYYNTSHIYDNKVLTRIDKNIYTKVHSEPEYTLLEFNTYDPNDIVLEKYEKIIEISNIKTYYVLSDDGHVNLRYGMIFLDFEYFGAKYRNETVVWGKNIVYDWPNIWWTLTLATQTASIAITFFMLISMIYSLFMKDKSRIHDSMVMYLWISMMLLIVSVILFPIGLHNMKSFLFGWWNPDNNIAKRSFKLCGDTADYFNSGECTIGYSYTLALIALVPLNIAYNLFKIMAKSNKRKLHLEEAPDEIVIDNIIFVKEKKNDNSTK